MHTNRFLICSLQGDKYSRDKAKTVHHNHTHPKFTEVNVRRHLVLSTFLGILFIYNSTVQENLKNSLKQGKQSKLSKKLKYDLPTRSPT